jgi:glutamate 5-kinase
MQSELKKKFIPAARRVVVKLGSSVVTTASGMNRERVGALTAQMARLHRDGHELVIVTSGARAAGLSRLGLGGIPNSIPEQQATAAIGQIRLMLLYEQYFSDMNLHIGQVLLTASDLGDRARYLNAKHTIDHLLGHGIIPVVNENDSVAVDELKFGDNDRLSALVAGLVGADLLILLTDVDGVYASDPRAGDAKLISVIDNVDEQVLSAAGSAGALGTGGMASKLEAARSAAHRGIPTIIANGTTDGILASVMNANLQCGTVVGGFESPISNRKHWIAYGMPAQGTLRLDAGAVKALSERGGSLLPSGIVNVSGSFDAGDCVRCEGPDGKEFARGLVTYDSADCARIIGRASREIEEILGYHMGDEVVHRDDLVLLADLEQSTNR